VIVAVMLTEYELQLAAGVGVRRHIASLVGGHRQVAAGVEATGDWTQNIEGACGELAVAKMLGRYWNGSVNTFTVGGDVGALQVRTRSRHYYDLIVRDKDRDGDWFVLATGVSPNYLVRGYIRAGDAKRDEWRADHGGHGPAWFVPQGALTEFPASVSRTLVAA
jgi:hypothetical protein